MKRFRSDPGLAIVHFFVNTFIIWFLLDICRHLLSYLPYLPFGYLLSGGKQSVLIMISAFLAFVVVVVRYTVVSASGDRIEIKRPGRKYCYLLDESEIIQESRKSLNASIFSPLYKHSLVIENKGGKKESIRLYLFSVGTLDALMNHILTMQVERNNELAAKDRTFREMFYAEGSYYLDRDSIIQKEWKSVRKISLVWIVLTTILLLASISGYEGYYSVLQTYAALVAGLICVAYIPFCILRTKRDAKSCPAQISFMGEHLEIGSDHYTMSGISRVSMTSAKLTTNSVYPVQRYLTVEYYDGKHQYWLGSQSSVPASEYLKLFDLVNEAFLNRQDKFQIISKRSFWNR